MKREKADKKELEKYAEKSGIKFVVLYGSRAIGTSQKKSDFDVAVFLPGGRSIFDNMTVYSDLLESLRKVFNVGEDKIDLTDLRKANILLRYEITSRGELLYGDEDEYAQYQAFAFRDYIDAEPLFKLENSLIKKRQELIKQSLT